MKLQLYKVPSQHTEFLNLAILAGWKLGIFGHTYIFIYKAYLWHQGFLNSTNCASKFAVFTVEKYIDLIIQTGFQFNDSWFVFHSSSWSFHESYFRKKHIFDESFRVNRVQNYGLKTCKKSTKLVDNVIILIIQQSHNFENILINDLFRHQTLYWAKVL